MRLMTEFQGGTLSPASAAGPQGSERMFHVEQLSAEVPDAARRLFGDRIELAIAYWSSLVSEGQALWLSLTWPRGLEELLKAKARLWAIISTGIVVLVLAYTAVRFPTEAWKVVLVGMS